MYEKEEESNLRYLALDTLSRLAYSQHKEVIGSIRKNQDVILQALKHKDISIRRRALDLLYSMCNSKNAGGIVGELLEYLPQSDFAIREELVLKIAILAEKYAVDLTWYVDVVLNLISQAGDFVSEDIWYRVIQIITNSNDDDLKIYSVKTVLKSIQNLISHELEVRVAAYIIGEFGEYVSNFEETNPKILFESLYKKYETSDLTTQGILLTTFIKMYNLYEIDEIREKIKEIFFSNRNYIDSEIQQRACEYFNLINGDFSILENLLDQMPSYPERESSVMKKN